MVCMAGHVKMASMLKLVMMENHTTTDDVINERDAAQILRKQLLDAHEPNLLDENDMHMFGSKPMTDPLDLVCCSTCKKPVKASQYAVHTDKCSSVKVNTNDNMVEDHSDSMKPPRKGRKIKLPRLKTSVADAAAIIGPESRFRDAPAPLATKMYHSQGNCRLRLELGQLYRESCVEHLGSYTTQNSSQENGLMVSQFSPSYNPAIIPGSQKSIVLQTKYLDQLPSSTSESCAGIPQQLTASKPNCSKEIKAERLETQVSAFKNEVSRARCNRAVAANLKSKGSKKAQQQKQSNGQQLHMSSPQ